MKSVHIRHIPDELHQVLKARAAMEGMSLNAFALKHLQRSAQQPTEEEVFERLRHGRVPDCGG